MEVQVLVYCLDSKGDPVMLDTLNKVRVIISEQLDVPIEKVKPESLIREELGADSLEKVEIIIQLEETFELVIHDKDAEKIKTVGDAADAIDRLLEECKSYDN